MNFCQEGSRRPNGERLVAELSKQLRLRTASGIRRFNMLTCNPDRNARTRNQFRPRVTGKGGATSYQLRQYAEATLGGGSLRKVVKLPEGEDENEWLAVNSEWARTRTALGLGWLTEYDSSGGLLQPNQPPIRRHHRVLLTAILPRDEGHR